MERRGATRIEKFLLGQAYMWMEQIVLHVEEDVADVLELTVSADGAQIQP